MRVPVYNLSGAIVREIDIRDDVFGVAANTSVVHQAMVRQLADRRLGLADTKTRTEVRGSTRKLYAQKHTGRARRGSIKSPLMRGGGIVFGPHQRSYRQDMPKKMRRLALRSAISSKVAEGGFRVVDGLALAEAKTKQMVAVLAALKVAEAPTLIITLQPDANMLLAARNLQGVKTVSAGALGILDILNHKHLVATEDAIRKVEEFWGPSSAGETGDTASAS